MNDSICTCRHGWQWHYAPNDVAVIKGQKAEGSCARCECRVYQHLSGPVPKPRRQPSDATIALVRAPRPTYVRPIEHKPVPPGRRNTYSDDREVPA